MGRRLLTLGLVVWLGACLAHTTPRPGASSLSPRAAIFQRSLAWVNDTIPVLRFQPPPVYGAWRLLVEECSGLTRLGWPALYVAPTTWLTTDGDTVMAFYAPSTQSIVFALGSETQRQVVMHEFLHWLLEPVLPPAPTNEPDAARKARHHPAQYFVERCQRWLVLPS